MKSALVLLAVNLIRVDQVGYLPDAPKIALVASEEARAFELRDAASGKVVHKGKVSPSTADPLSGEKLSPIDFSSFRKPGEYVIHVPEIGDSYKFRIAADVYHKAWHLAMRSFYGQRCGTRVDLAPDYPQFKYEECHKAGEWHASSGNSGGRMSVKGWHDAGDYGRYVVNSGLTTGTLLWSWELYSGRLTGLSLKIPESVNRLPDVLDEIRWNLEWMLSMQDGDGGVYHKQTPVRHSAFVMPDQDSTVSVVMGTGAAPYKSTCATADLAAVMAIAARVYGPYDKAFAAEVREAAVKAFAWTEKYPAVMFTNPAGVNTGAYGDRSCADERLWAAAELWRTTGEAAYHKFFQSNYKGFLAGVATPPAWPGVGSLGLWTYVLSQRKDADAALTGEIRAATLAAAENIAERVKTSPHRTAMLETDFVWGSNGVAANYGLLLLVAHRMDIAKGYRDAALEQLHYLLGRNPFSVSWVTHVGTNWFKKPHHRPSGADAVEEPWPGLLSGGPNRRVQDPEMKKLPAGLPPMKMWLDEEGSYASNENAINWNAALVFLLSGVL